MLNISLTHVRHDIGENICLTYAEHMFNICSTYDWFWPRWRQPYMLNICSTWVKDMVELRGVIFETAALKNILRQNPEVIFKNSYLANHVGEVIRHMIGHPVCPSGAQGSRLAWPPRGHRSCGQSPNRPTGICIWQTS